jgi:dipeptidyl aminopeptidase/acylaminoacyl peptidase
MTVDPGEGESMLLSDEVFGDLWNSELRWSPDGSLLLFTSAEEGRGQVYVMDRAGSLVVIAEGQAPEVSWSPEGDRVAVAVGEGEAKELFVVGADGSGLRKVGDGSMPAWRPVAEGEPAAGPICALPTMSSVGAVVLTLAALRTRGPVVDRSTQVERSVQKSLLS